MKAQALPVRALLGRQVLCCAHLLPSTPAIPNPDGGSCRGRGAPSSFPVGFGVVPPTRVEPALRTGEETGA